LDVSRMWGYMVFRTKYFSQLVFAIRSTKDKRSNKTIQTRRRQYPICSNFDKPDAMLNRQGNKTQGRVAVPILMTLAIIVCNRSKKSKNGKQKRRRGIRRKQMMNMPKRTKSYIYYIKVVGLQDIECGRCCLEIGFDE
jgi:hypothetical protein